MSTSRVWISAIRCGSCAVSASRSSASRSRSAFSTTSIRLSGPSGASCARLPIAPARRDRDAAGFGRQIAADRVEQRRFADAVAADKADARAGHDLHRAVVDQKPSGDPDRDIGDGKHAALSPERPPNATRLSVNSCSEGRLDDSAAAVSCLAGSSPARRSSSISCCRSGESDDSGRMSLLQPFANGIADRPAGPVVELFEIAVDSAFHGISSRWRVPPRNVR